MRADRVMRTPVPVPWISPQGERSPKHGKEFRSPQAGDLGRARRSNDAGHRSVRHHPRDGLGPHPPRLTIRSAWIGHTGELPITEGTLIRLQVDRLPGGNDPLPAS